MQRRNNATDAQDNSTDPGAASQNVSAYLATDIGKVSFIHILIIIVLILLVIYFFKKDFLTQNIIYAS